MSNFRIFVFLPIIFLAIGLTNCKESNKVFKAQTTTVSGTISGLNRPTVSIESDISHIVNVDQSGSFTHNQEINTPTIFRIRLGYTDLDVFAKPGDNVSLTMDIRNPGSIKFEGQNAYENKYLSDFAQFRSMTIPQNYNEFYGQPEEIFIKAVEQRSQDLITHLQEFQKQNGVFNEEFNGLVIDDINYETAIMKMNYKNYFPYIFADSTQNLTQTFDSFLQNYEIDNEVNLSLPSFKDFLITYLDFKTGADSLNKYSSTNVEKYHLIGNNFKNPTIKNFLYYQTVKGMLQLSINDAAEVIDLYNEHQTNKNYLDEINSVFNTWRPLLRGKQAPVWQANDPNGKLVKLTDFNGSWLYIDLWATWCGPCIREIPFLEKLHNELSKYKNITFVSISVDENKESWSKMLKDRNLKGVQLHAGMEDAPKLMSDYKVSGIPRFLIIDPEGNIYDANAPRPSAPEIGNLLTRLATK